MANDEDDAKPKARRPRRNMGLAIGFAVLAMVVLCFVRQQRAAEERRLGEALFHGKSALSARLPGHAETLPALATSCSNCHEQANRAPARADARLPGAGPASPITYSYALSLNREGLTGSRPRRGGPPSSYDRIAFCQLLRSGADPATVIISNEMPRYEVNEEQCRQLWAYLLDR